MYVDQTPLTLEKLQQKVHLFLFKFDVMIDVEISLNFLDLTTQLSGRDEASNQLSTELQNLKSQLAGMQSIDVKMPGLI